MRDIEKIDSDIYVVIASNIKKYRKLKGYTQAQLAEIVSLSHEFIRRIESKKGSKNFSIDTIYRIAQALDIDVGKLFNDVDDKK